MSFALKTIAFLFCAGAMLPAWAAPASRCATPTELIDYRGTWLPEKAIQELARKKDHKVLRLQEGSYAVMVQVNANGHPSWWNNWHEGGDLPGCVVIQDKRLYLRNPDQGTAGQLSQPFARIPYVGIYAVEEWASDTVFGERCYQSNKQEQWCFSGRTVAVNGRPYIFGGVTMDVGEYPGYGIVTGNPFSQNWPSLIFVPTATGFHVYQDTPLAEDRVPAGPGISKPWRTLTRSHTPAVPR